jgi:hypothetical protein
VPVAYAYTLWDHKELIPHWMPIIQSVEVRNSERAAVPSADAECLQHHGVAACSLVVLLLSVWYLETRARKGEWPATTQHLHMQPGTSQACHGVQVTAQYFRASHCEVCPW